MVQKARYTFNYDAMKALNEDLQMRSDWLFPICTGAERLKRKRAEDPPDAEAGSAPAPPNPRVEPSRAIWCSIRFRLGHDGSSPSGSAGDFIGIEREQAYAEGARAGSTRRAACQGRAASRQGQACGTTHRLRRLIELGLITPGTACTIPRRGTRPRSAPTDRSPAPMPRIDPQDRRPCAGRARLQRLDLLALRG